MSALESVARHRIERCAAPAPLQKKFLAEIQEFLSHNLTLALRKAGRETTGVHSPIDACRQWHRMLHKRGWIAPAWPVEFGGTGWTPEQRFLFERECAENDAPILFASGIRALGPLLIAVGSNEQRQRHLPAILSGEAFWCQGFSEPNAGSDLAALSLNARCKGDGYVLNGGKIWTTGAQFAQWMFCLARTERRSRPQDGITFLLLPMNSPGLHVTPIRTMDGDEEFCQVAFDDVHVPIANRVGKENEGWNAAKKLMSFARSNNTNSGHVRRALRQLDRVAAQMELGASFSLRIAAIRARFEALEAFELQALSSCRLENADQQTTSVLKTMATELHQSVTELAIEAAAYHGLPALHSATDGRECGTVAMKKYLATRAASIYSGTNEVHRNIVAGSLLGRFQG